MNLSYCCSLSMLSACDPFRGQKSLIFEHLKFGTSTGCFAIGWSFVLMALNSSDEIIVKPCRDGRGV